MGEIMRKFNTLLWKNFQVRKKKWLLSILGQIYVIGMFASYCWVLISMMTFNTNAHPSERSVRFTPKSNDTTTLMEQVKICLQATDPESNISISGYETQEEMLNVMANNTNFESTVGIVFKNSSLPNNLEYEIKNGTNLHFHQSVESCLNKSKNTNTTENKLNTTDLQNKTSVDVKLFQYANITLVVLLFICLVELSYISNEKISGINVLMSLNGVDNWLNLLSWLVSSVIWNAISFVFVVITLSVSWVTAAPAFIENGNRVIFFMALLLNVIHALCFTYHFGSYFNTPWKSNLSAMGFFTLPFYVTMVPKLVNVRTNRLFAYLKIISPAFCLDGIFDEISIYEKKGDGIGFTNIFSAGSGTKPFETSIGMIMLFSILGAILHFFMALYIHAIKPGEYGVKRHPFAWFLKKNETGDDQIQLDSDEFEQKKEFEKIPAGSLKAGVQIRKLKKIYSTGFINKSEFHALKEVSIDFYRGEITALLGHNGAGKTTMMSILSGLTGLSGGVVIINGQNVLNNHDVISNNVGLCPQVNITVPDLNVYQQVLFFAKLRAKNKTSAQIKEDVENLLSKVNLQDKKNCALDQLSGGQKRRLCLALAVIGDANVLIFDEPTSGIDTEGKREVWDIILAMRNHKTILISTHDMEEADILGDRIAIMHSGKINSYGTSMFLKKLHGDGQVEVTLSLESGCDTAKILEIIGEDVKTLNQRNDSIVLAIPNPESLPETLDKLESSKKKLGITGISASIMTLEQVFVKITEEVDHNIDNTLDEVNNDLVLFDRNTGFAHFMQTFRGYLIKKYACAMHNSCSFIFSLVLPCLLSTLILLFFPLVDLSTVSQKQNVVISSWVITLLMPFLIAYFVTQPLSEIRTGFRHLQNISGASKVSYWGSMFIFDFTHYMITIILLLASLILGDHILDTQIYNVENVIMYLLLSLLFGLAGLFSVYVFSLFNFSELTSKYCLITVPVVIANFLYLIYFYSNQLMVMNVFLLIPQVNFYYAISYYFWISYNNGTYWNFEITNKLSLPYCLIIFVISFVLFIGIIYTVEQKIIAKVLGKIKKNNSITNIAETDELVRKERDIVSKEVEKRLTKTIEHNNENVFLAHELRKSYGNLQVVKDISFRVKSGECFGLLGVNGAGKSTTFKMLTGEESACHGKMYLKDIGMHDNRGDYLSKMGYCPQHDALIETLNAWDHLYLFARLRGIPESQIKSSVEGWIKRLNLTACASRPSQTYSGGNKRRLNIALALIGQPSLVLMDEPTTGVDPAARRSLWNTLKYCQESGQSIIFTSHSMEECEALCNRLVIMVNGKLVCVGAVQELKQRFGAGYNIHVKMSPASSVEDVQHIKETIESTIRCQKMDENSGFLGYHVTDPGATWTVMYRMMNTLKNNYNCIEDFAVLSSTLEQLFIQFARAEHTDLTSHEIP